MRLAGRRQAGAKRAERSRCLQGRPDEQRGDLRIGVRDERERVRQVRLDEGVGRLSRTAAGDDLGAEAVPGLPEGQCHDVPQPVRVLWPVRVEAGQRVVPATKLPLRPMRPALPASSPTLTGTGP